MANVVCRRLLSGLRPNTALPSSGRTTERVAHRTSHGYTAYRELNYEPNRPFIQRMSHFYGGLMWCYIFWMFRHNWRELIGEHIWPPRDKWTNQELGVPSD